MEEQRIDEKEKTGEKSIDKRLEGASWGFLLIWVGVSFLVKFNMGVGLLGVGFITLGTQIARKVSKLKFEGFWIFIGVLLVLGGILDLFTPALPLVPILLIVAGAVLLISNFRVKGTEKK